MPGSWSGTTGMPWRFTSPGAAPPAARLAGPGADYTHVVNDVAFNQGPFISPAQFHEFITPYLAREVAHIRKRGVIPFVHTDGNIMPILDDYLSVGAACFQSVDPMAGMGLSGGTTGTPGTLAP